MPDPEDFLGGYGAPAPAADPEDFLGGYGKAPPPEQVQAEQDQRDRQQKVSDIFHEEVQKVVKSGSGPRSAEGPALANRLAQEVPGLNDEQRNQAQQDFNQQLPNLLQAARFHRVLQNVKEERAAEGRNTEKNLAQGEYALERVPFAGSAVGLAKAATTYKSAKAFESGAPSPDDYLNIARHVADTEEEEQKGTGRKIVDLSTKLPAFVVEWLAMGGVGGVGRKAATEAAAKTLGGAFESGASKLAAQAALSAGEKAAPELALSLGEKAATTATGALGEGALRTVARPDVLTAGTLQRMTPQFVPDDRGGYQTVPGKSLTRAAVESLGSEMIQNIVFSAGNPFEAKAGNSFLAKWGNGLKSGVLTNEATQELQYWGQVSPQGSALHRFAFAETPEERTKALSDFTAQVVAFGGVEAVTAGRAHVQELAAKQKARGEKVNTADINAEAKADFEAWRKQREVERPQELEKMRSDFLGGLESDLKKAIGPKEAAPEAPEAPPPEAPPAEVKPAEPQAAPSVSVEPGAGVKEVTPEMEAAARAARDANNQYEAEKNRLAGMGPPETPRQTADRLEKAHNLVSEQLTQYKRNLEVAKGEQAKGFNRKEEIKFAQERVKAAREQLGGKGWAEGKGPKEGSLKDRLDKARIAAAESEKAPPPAPEPVKPPEAPLSPIERMRQHQKGQVVPPAKPQSGLEPRGEKQLEVKNILDQAGLNAKERHTLENRLYLERAHEDIGADPEMKVTRQRVKQLEETALEKVAHVFGQDNPVKSMADAIGEKAEARRQANLSKQKAELAARGIHGPISPIEGEAEEDRRAGIQAISAEHAQQLKNVTAYDELISEWTKEAERAKAEGRELDPALVAKVGEASRLFDEAERGARPERAALEESLGTRRKDSRGAPEDRGAASGEPAAGRGGEPAGQAPEAAKVEGPQGAVPDTGHPPGEPAATGPEGEPAAKSRGRKPGPGGGLKRRPGETEWNYQERKLKDDGALTLAQYVSERGKIKPSSLTDTLEDYKAKLSPKVLSEKNGEPIDTFVDGLVTAGVIREVPHDKDEATYLLDLLEQHHTIDPGKQTKEAQGYAEHAAGQQAEALDAKRARIAAFNKPPAVGDAAEPTGATAGPVGDIPGVPFRHEPIERAGINQEDWPPAINPIIGGQDPPSTPLRQLVEQFKEKGLKTLRAVRDYFGELSHEMAPRTTRMDRIAGEKLSQLNAADNYVREAIPSYIDRILGPDATPKDDMRAGAVWVENRLRHIREYSQGEADRLAGEIAQQTEGLKRLKDALANDPQVKALKAEEAIRERIAKTQKALSDLEKEHKGRVKEASEVKTTIHILNPAGLRSEADFEEAKNDPKIQAILQRRREILVPELDKNYRMAQGTPDDEDIHSPTQIKGDEGNLKAIRPGETISPSMMFTSPNRGKLTNTRISRFGFARKATGSAQGYDLSLSAMIEHSFRHGYKRAMKAEAIRDMVSKGLAIWDHEKAFHPGHEEIPNVRPPQGTQENEKGQTSLFVKEPANDEFRRAIAVDKPMRLEEVRQVMNLLTKGALASTVEAAYHTKNIMTMWTKPGMHPLDFIQNAYGVIKGHTEIQSQITELARIGALKEGGFEGQSILGKYEKYNPLTWAQKFLTVTDKAMRLTMDDAFDRLSKQGRVENTETNRRNFINQLGQYNRKAQNHIVAWLRDTGLGPFATAGTRYYMEGMRGLTFEPGAKASSTGHAVGLRAEVMGRTLGILAATAVANYLFWGRVDGDDTTPFGALKIGDAPGKTSYVDLTNLTGMTRGLRQTGALGVIEGSRSDKTKGQVIDKSTDQIVHSLIHPAAGPPVQSAYTGFTGKNISGYQIARKAEPGESQHVENLKSAAWNVNPVVGSLSGHNRPAAQAEKATTMERLMDLLGPYGIHYRQVKSKGLR